MIGQALEWVKDIGIMAGAFTAVIGAGVALSRVPAVKFAWRKLVMEPRAEATAKVVKPLVEEAAQVTRAASARQHKEQNEILAEQNRLMAAGFTEVSGRLDKGAEIMATHTTQIAALDAAIKAHHTARTRDGDQ